MNLTRRTKFRLGRDVTIGRCLWCAAMWLTFRPFRSPHSRVQMPAKIPDAIVANELRTFVPKRRVAMMSAAAKQQP